MSWGDLVRKSNARTWLVVGLALNLAGCGSSSSTPSGGSSTAAALPSVQAPSSASASSSPTISPTIAPPPSPVVVAAAKPEPPLKQLWQVGGPRPSKDGGCCVTVAPDGKLWVSAEWDSTFWIIDPNGKYLESWGTPGKGEGQFDFPVKDDGWGAVAFDPDGTFYVADAGNRRVQKFDKDRHFIKAWGSFGTDDGQFATPALISSDGKGHVYVSDEVRLDVQEFSSDGSYIRTLAADYVADDLLATAIDARGHVYVDNGPIILVFDADGLPLPGIDLSTAGGVTAGMALDAAGNLYIAINTGYLGPSIDTLSIYELDASGAVLHAWPGDADMIALDPVGGALYSSFFRDPFISKLELPKP